MLRRSLLQLLMLASAGGVVAQAPEPLAAARLTDFLADAGLENAYLFQAATAPGGELWLATSIGLVRYDGYRWEHFTTDDGLPSDFVRCVCVTRAGELWVGTDEGAGVFSEAGFDRRGTAGAIAGPRVRRIVEDPEDGVWFCCDHWPTPADSAGLTLWRGGRAKTWTVADGLPSDYVSDLFIDSRGRRFVLTDRGLARFTDGGFTRPLAAAAAGVGPEYVWSAAESRRHGVLFATRTAIYRLDADGCTRVPLVDPRPHVGPRLVAAPDDEVYGFRDGDPGTLMRWDGAGFELVTPPVDGARGPIEHAAVGPDGGIWFAGYDFLRRWHPEPRGWSELRDTGAPDLVDRHGRVWGHDETGAWLADGERFVSLPGLGPELVLGAGGDVWSHDDRRIVVCRDADPDRQEVIGSPFETIRDLVVSQGGTVWLWGGGGAELAWLDPRGQWRPLTFEPGRAIASVRRDVADGLLVVTTGPDERAAFLASTAGREEIPLPSPIRATRSSVHIERQPGGELVLFGHAGLWEQSDSGEWRERLDLPGRDAILRFRSATALWLGSRGITGGRSGLVRIQDGAVRPFDYSPRGNVLCTLTDGSALVPVRGGLLRLPLAGPPHSMVRPGFPAIHAALVDDRGRLWAAGETGLLRYVPDDRPPETDAIGITDRLTEGNRLAVRVTIRDYMRPMARDIEPVVSFRVDGGAWSDFGSLPGSTLQIGRLGVGDHRIEVRAMDIDGNVDDSPAEVSIRVLPVPLQSRPWFWPVVLLVLGVLGALLGMGFRSRVVRRALRDQLAAEARSRALESQLMQAQKMDAIGQLAGGVAHDFNNLLTVVLGNSALVRSAVARADDDVTASVGAAIDDLEYAAQQAAALTRRLLAFARKETGDPRPMNAADALQDIERLARRVIAADIEFRTSLRSSATVMADSVQFEQVVLNLALNAADAMPTGGRIDVELTDVDISARERCDAGEVGPGSYVRLSVRDNGVGMSEEVRTRAFEPFFSTKGMGTNTGLGLSIVHGIVTQAGGCVAIRSTPGEGTTISVLWPRCDAKAASTEDPPLPAEPTHRSGTILVCDDEPAVLALTARILRDAGYEVLTAASPDEVLCLERSRAGGIDLLITDIVMPGSNGPALASALRKRRPEIGIVFVSGYDPGASERTRIDPDAVFLAKPFSSNQLLEAAAATLRRCRPVVRR